MRDPKPVQILMLLTVGIVVLLALWWLSLPGAERLQRLTHLASAEHAEVLPPAGLLEQIDWLTSHRLSRLQGMLGYLGLLLVVGLVEGLLRRQCDVLGGFRLAWWTTGVLSFGVLVGSVVFFVLLPAPTPWWCSAVGGGIVAILGYGMALGFPAMS